MLSGQTLHRRRPVVSGTAPSLDDVHDQIARPPVRQPIRSRFNVGTTTWHKKKRERNERETREKRERNEKETRKKRKGNEKETKRKRKGNEKETKRKRKGNEKETKRKRWSTVTHAIDSREPVMVQVRSLRPALSGAIWILAPDSACSREICSPPRPMTAKQNKKKQDTQ